MDFARKAHHYPKYGAIAFILVMMASKEGNARRHLGSVRSGVRLKTHARTHARAHTHLCKVQSILLNTYKQQQNVLNVLIAIAEMMAPTGSVLLKCTLVTSSAEIFKSDKYVCVDHDMTLQFQLLYLLRVGRT